MKELVVVVTNNNGNNSDDNNYNDSNNSGNNNDNNNDETIIIMIIKICTIQNARDFLDFIPRLNTLGLHDGGRKVYGKWRYSILSTTAKETGVQQSCPQRSR